MTCDLSTLLVSINSTPALVGIPFNVGIEEVGGKLVPTCELKHLVQTCPKFAWWHSLVAKG
jgi:hypothetical protein